MSAVPQARTQALLVRASATLPPPPDSGATLSTMFLYKEKNGTVVQAVVNGRNNVFTPPVANTPSGGQGPANTSFDGVPCNVSMSRNYHIHVFMGLYVNGTEYAIPRGVGVVVPLNPNDQTIEYATKCFYSTHTHDSSGIVHVEDANGGVYQRPDKTPKYTTGQLFAVWGITVGASGFGQFSGPLEVFTSGQQYRALGTGTNRVISETLLQQWTGDPNAIPLYDHEVIWFLVGPNYPSALPNVDFAPGY